MKKLERSLSLPYVIAISIGGMLGSGIFVLPGFASGSMKGNFKQLAKPIFSINFPDNPRITKAHKATPSDLFVRYLNNTYNMNNTPQVPNNK